MELKPDCEQHRVKVKEIDGTEHIGFVELFSDRYEENDGIAGIGLTDDDGKMPFLKETEIETLEIID